MAETEELVYLALGGAGEIGMNCYMYGYGPAAARRWIIVDLGIGFGDMETAPGVELVLPDIEFAIAERDRIEAIFLTHAHEDHVGAIPHVYDKLRVPIYARPFTAEVIRRKLDEAGMDSLVVRQAALGGAVGAGPFRVEFLDVTHSIPEASSLVIRSPAGTVVHTGDFKLDRTPTMGAPATLEPFRRLGDEGVLALACDSTNVFLPGNSASESSLTENIRRLIAGASGAVAATTFASNVARLRTLAVAAHETGRSVVIAGRAMRRMVEIAVETGLLTDFPRVVDEDDSQDIPRENLFYLVTGSQGEGRAALARIAAGTHPNVVLREGDTVLFSSKTIPGNEAGIYRLYNRLSENGVEVIDGDMEHIHASGHARRDDLEEIYKAVRPRVAVPMHGEHRHLVEHAKWARRWGTDTALVAANGTMVRLDGNRPGPVDHVETGRVYLDGTTPVGALDGVIRERLKLARQGLVVASVVIDDAGDLISDTEVRCFGAPKDGPGWTAPLDEMLGEAVDLAIEDAPARSLRSDGGVEELAARAIRRVAGRLWGKRPVISVIVTRLEEE